MELCIGGLVHLEGDVSDDSCKAKASGNCFQFLFIVDCLELPVGIDEFKPVGTVKKILFLHSYFLTRSERVLCFKPAPWQIGALLPPYVIMMAMTSRGRVQPLLGEAMSTETASGACDLRLLTWLTS